jgi:hypothetical protein
MYEKRTAHLIKLCKVNMSACACFGNINVIGFPNSALND